MLLTGTIVQNIAAVRERIERAARRANRSPDTVRLVAVSKTVEPERIREAYAAGLREFGENRVQEAAAKKPILVDLDIRWHLVGHLQSNKAQKAAELFDEIQSVDSLALAEKLDRAVEKAGRRCLPVLLQVRMGGEPTKSGIEEAELLPLVRGIASLAHLAVQGLMSIPPFFDDAEQARPYFRRLRELAGELASARIRGISAQELSMGMSHDFEVAIEEGATVVRIGTAIFGERPKG